MARGGGTDNGAVLNDRTKRQHSLRGDSSCPCHSCCSRSFCSRSCRSRSCCTHSDVASSVAAVLAHLCRSRLSCGRLCYSRFFRSRSCEVSAIAVVRPGIAAPLVLARPAIGRFFVAADSCRSSRRLSLKFPPRLSRSWLSHLWLSGSHP